MAEYTANAAVKSLIVIKGERRGKECDEKNSNHCFAVWFSADAQRNDRPNRKFASDRCVLVFPEKRHRVDNASVRDIYR